MSLGYDVVTAGGADGAVEMLDRDRRTYLVFSDIVLPGTRSGRELAAKVRARRPAPRWSLPLAKATTAPCLQTCGLAASISS